MIEEEVSPFHRRHWYIDWRQIALDLHEAGLDFKRQAALLGCEWSTMQRWLQGTEPKYSVGNAWLQLHQTVLGKFRTQKRLRGEPV